MYHRPRSIPDTFFPINEHFLSLRFSETYFYCQFYVYRNSIRMTK